MVIELMAVHARTMLLKKLPDYDTKIVMINTAKKKNVFPHFTFCQTQNKLMLSALTTENQWIVAMQHLNMFEVLLSLYLSLTCTLSAEKKKKKTALSLCCQAWPFPLCKCRSVANMEPSAESEI